MKKVLLLALLFSMSLVAQEELDSRNWDNIMYVSNKIGWGSDTWRHTAEFQSRFKSDLGELEQWHLEYAATYLKSKHWEITPDFRFTKKPDHNEYRPGIGVIYKKLYPKSQIVQQVKYQWDKENTGYSSHGIRYGFFYNYLFSEKIIGSALVAAQLEFGEDYNGFLGLRSGLAVAYIFNEAHSLNIGYYYGLLDKGDHSYTHVGIFSLQLIINIRKDYKYLPAKYINL